MPERRTTLERAFEIAQSGACASVGDIRAQLRGEGRNYREIAGSALTKQLRGIIKAARAKADH